MAISVTWNVVFTNGMTPTHTQLEQIKTDIEQASATIAASGATSMTERARGRPSWRLPTFTVGVLRSGASMMPLDELPTTTSHSRSKER